MEPRPRHFFLLAAAWLGSVAVYLALFPALYMHQSWAFWSAKRVLIEEAGSAHTVVLGDSRAMYGIVPDLLPSPAISLAVEGSSPLEAYYLFRRYLASHQPPRLVIVSWSPIRFLHDEYFWQNSARLGGLSVPELREVLAEADRLGDSGFASFSFGDCRWCAWGYLAALKARWPFLYQSEVSYGRLAMRGAENAEAISRMVAERGTYAAEVNSGKVERLGREANQLQFEPSPLLAMYFDRLLALAKERGVPVRFAHVPTNPVSAATVASRFGSDFAEFLRGREGASFRRLDGPLTYETRYFADQDHLTREGAQRYTYELIRKLAPGAEMGLSASPPGN